jgi:cytoskeleton protein RodZ
MTEPVTVAPTTTAEAASVATVETAAGADAPAHSVPAAPDLATLGPPIRAAPIEPSASAAQAAAIEADRQITIRATYDSWVQVRDRRNEPMFERVLRVGDVYSVPSVAGLLLDTGNAGALEIEVDGRRLPPLGAFGEVRRDIALDKLAPDRATTP